ncbi:MAG: hypothetical protein AAF798_01125 [Bacteroidota bacterium]
MKRLIVPFTLILAMMLSTSCTQRILDFTIVSSKNVDLSKAASFQRGKTRVADQDGAYIILIIPTGIPNLKEALDRAIEQVPGAVALVDGVISSKSWSAILVGYTAFMVEGTPLIDPSLAVETSVEDSPYKYVKLDKDGNVEESKILTKEEYEAYKADIAK